MLYTSSYKNFNTNYYSSCSISGDKGKNAGYTGNCYSELAPKKEFWRIWKDNIGKVHEMENNKFYIREYYKTVLKQLSPEKIASDLDCKALLCYEDSNEFCHRHIVAAWLELLLEEEVHEIKVNNFDIEKVERPAYIKEYLESFMKEYNNMHGFQSLRAAYLFDEGEKIEAEAEKYDQYSNRYSRLMQQAAFLRCDADMAEDRYIAKKEHEKIKVLKLENK